MATPVSYWALATAIKTQLDAQLASIRPLPQVVVEQEFVPNESWIGIYRDSRTAPANYQNLAAGTKTRFLVSHKLWIWRYAIELPKAVQFRDSLLDSVEVALMVDRTFSGACETSWLEGGRLVSADDPSKKIGFYAGAEVALICDAFARTT